MWTTLLKRILNIGKAQTYVAIERIEDPVKMMSLAVTELDDAIGKLSKSIAVAMASQKKLEKDHEQFRLEAISWYQKATIAMQNGREDLAKQALTQKTLSERKMTEYQFLAQNAARTVEQLNEQLADYRLKLEEARTKQSIYSAKAETAKTQKKIAESLGGMNTSALANMERYEKKIDQWVNEAESLRLVADSTGSFERDMKEMETDLLVKSDFEKLKSQLKSQNPDEAKLNEIQKKFEEMNSPKAIQENKQNIDKLLNDFFNK